MKMSLEKKNGGYTLVELIVVIAIMVVLAGGSVVAFASLRNYRAKTAKDQICNNLKEARTEAMAKKTEWMQICKDSDGLKIKTSYRSAGDTMLSGNIHVSYTEKGSSTEIEIDSSHSLILTYARVTGAFEGIKTSTTPDANGKLPNQMNGSSVVYCEKIHIENGARTKGYTITLNQETGKFVCKED